MGFTTFTSPINGHVDDKLQAQHAELKVLLSYKDKEYPVKAIKISNLQKEIENLRIANREEMEELEHIVNTEFTKHEKTRIQLTNKITRNVTETAVDMMHMMSSLKDMALQNM